MIIEGKNKQSNHTQVIQNSSQILFCVCSTTSSTEISCSSPSKPVHINEKIMQKGGSKLQELFIFIIKILKLVLSNVLHTGIFAFVLNPISVPCLNVSSAQNCPKNSTKNINSHGNQVYCSPSCKRLLKLGKIELENWKRIIHITITIHIA